MKSITKKDVTAVILSGGRATRMGGQNKGLILFKDKPLISYVTNVVSENVNSILVSANKNLDLYQEFGTVIADDLADFQGPLAGISKAMHFANTPYLLVLPCDGPFVSSLLLERLIQSMQQNEVDICVASNGDKIHPTYSLINITLKDNLDKFLQTGGRKFGLWLENNNALKVDFSDQPDIFINLNSPQDFADAD
ncbi:MAG: molybdenum cofactor guanylyltransferase [Candidatus Ruthia sp.]|nr:molybdenum cofactor guanylyltransferase [Candidatus Ruthturnera sp.]MBT4122347.1 molybdenum cofactor guanylyltransferase [Candidatus Ruthturnera sp.]MBT4668049.1 molybdenum cofactor guanylyltransferase [Candidatus Ruthturnera sp.]MBT6922171.1 molybdenum cofactor guanylyltransferase [Candidatus Ruthturnera sp.]